MSPHSVVATVAPNQLNNNVSSGPTSAGDFTNGSLTAFTGIDSGVIDLLANTVYQIAFQTQVNVTTTSVPEPATLSIFGASLIGLGFAFKRRMNKQA